MHPPLSKELLWQTSSSTLRQSSGSRARSCRSSACSVSRSSATASRSSRWQRSWVVRAVAAGRTRGPAIRATGTTTRTVDRPGGFERRERDRQRRRRGLRALADARDGVGRRQRARRARPADRGLPRGLPRGALAPCARRQPGDPRRSGPRRAGRTRRRPGASRASLIEPVRVRRPAAARGSRRTR